MSVRILFVDDEVRVLDGLKRSLRPLRHEWTTAFATGGEEALSVLAREPFDAIVTDMRMPGMDGAALLNEAAARYPDVLRLVLSGQSDLESVVKSASVTHRYLAKPCSMEALKDAINRVVALRDLLAASSLKQLVLGTGSIPSVPPLCRELTNCLKSPKASIEMAGAIIQKDMGMTAKVLQLVNSPFFGAAGRITNAADAVVYLGLDTIRTLALTLRAFSEFEPGGATSFSIQDLWRHSLATAVLAERILKSLETGTAPEYGQIRVAGLLHDIGRLLLAANVPDGYEQARRLAEEKQIVHWEAEEQVFGSTHAEAGAYLLGLWGLPEPVVQAVAYHHTPARCPRPAPPILTALHVADSLEYLMREPESGAPESRIDRQYLSDAGLDGRLEEWRELCRSVTREEFSGA
jgi:putative nucleotidyltransferase with HDIG domain